MIDIDDFKQEHQEAIDAANEYARRWEKGLPTDRFANGAKGEAMVGQGIRAFQTIMAIQNAALIEMFNEIQERGADAMRLHHSDSKYATAHKSDLYAAAQEAGQ